MDTHAHKFRHAKATHWGEDGIAKIIIRTFKDAEEKAVERNLYQIDLLHGSKNRITAGNWVMMLTVPLYWKPSPNVHMWQSNTRVL